MSNVEFDLHHTASEAGGSREVPAQEQGAAALRIAQDVIKNMRSAGGR